MDLIVKHFNELSTTELYEIIKTRFEIFVLTISNFPLGPTLEKR